MLDERISRRQFIRLFAFFVFFLIFGFTRLFVPKSFSAFKPSSSSNDSTYNTAFAQTAGSWTIGPSTSAIPVHSTLLYTGKIFYVSGSGYNLANQFGPYIAKILDPSNGSETSVSLNEDIFCAGHTQLSNGNVLFAGGTKIYDISPNNCNGYWHGLNVAYEFDVQTSSLNKVSTMKQARWYPTCIMLPDKRIFVTGGMDDYGTENRLVEIYDPNSKSFNLNYDSSRTYTYCVGSEFVSQCPGAGSPCYGGTNNAPSPWLSLYPRMHLMPSGLLVTAGQVPEIRTWNPSNGQWRDVGTTSQYRSFGTSILLPLQNTLSERGRVLIVGGSSTDAAPATTSVEMLDFNQGSSTTPNIHSANSNTYGRKLLCPVILPNGKVLIIGGSSQANENPVYIPEMYDPVTGSWTSLPAASVPRVYHSVALLLPDGSIWTAGGSPTRDTWEPRTEIYKPDYFFSGTRPTITGTPLVGAYGNSITISTPDAANISIVSLVKLPCATHSYDVDSRLIWLQVTNRSSGSVRVAAPLNANLAPPGYYMIHVLNGSNIPSVAKIIQIPGTGSGIPDTTPPAQVAGLTVTAAGSNQLNLAWTSNTEPDLNHYNVYRGTAAGFPVTLGTTTPVGTPTTNSFSNTGLNPSTTYYYKVAAVDNAGNIGSLSLEQSGTTSPPADTTPPAQVAGLTVTAAGSNQLNLAWTSNTEPDLNHYNVYRGTAANFPVIAGTTPVGTPTTNSFSNTGLNPSTTYYYKVAAVDNAGNIGSLSLEQSGTTSPPADTTPPAQVAGLTVTAAGANQLNLAWTSNTEPDLNHYNVYRGTAAGFPVTLGTTTPVGTPTTNSFSNTGLNPSTTYYYKVAAVDNAGNIGSLSAERSATTGPPADTTPPAQVAGLTVTPAGSNQLNLAWTSNTETDLNHYNVYRGTAAGFPVTLGTTTPVGTPTTNSFSNTGLNPSTTYYYKVSAVDNAGNIGTLSAERSGATSPADTTIPSVAITSPANNASLAPGNILVQGTASDNIGGSGILDVQVRTDNNPWSIAAPKSAGDWSTWSITVSLTTLGQHFIQARATDKANNMMWYDTFVNITQQPDTTPPAQVAGLTVTAAGSNQLNLAWTSNTEPDLNHYNVYRGTAAGFPVTLGTTTPVGTPTTNSFSNTGLNPSTTYYYKVAAVDNAANIGSLSAERSAATNPSSDTTIPSVAITTPANNASLARGNILVQGTASDNAGGSGIFDVQVRTDNNPWFIATPKSTGDWSTWSITVQLTTPGQHLIEARATDKANNMTWYDTFVNIT